MTETTDVDIVVETVKMVGKDVYEDGLKPVVKPTGELGSLIPRTIKAALAPLEKWIMVREYNLEATRRLLEEKLQNTPAELIESPEPYIAVPALQYTSYCMDNDELRNLYANLLANSMTKVVKDGVHPGFVEIIKQLSPDEAKMLRYLYENPLVPSISIRVHKKPSGMVVVQHLFTNIMELCGCENINGYEKAVDNLTRLGLLKIPVNECLTDKAQYEPLKTHPYVLSKKEELEALENVARVDFGEGHIELTQFGKSFCSICLKTKKVIIINS